MEFIAKPEFIIHSFLVSSFGKRSFKSFHTICHIIHLPQWYFSYVISVIQISLIFFQKRRAGSRSFVYSDTLITKGVLSILPLRGFFSVFLFSFQNGLTGPTASSFFISNTLPNSLSVIKFSRASYSNIIPSVCYNFKRNL